MKKIILSADDFGLSPGVNKGIIEAFQKGMLTHTAIMANVDFLEDAMVKWKENPELELSAHVTLGYGKPLLETSSCLVDEKGVFLRENGQDWFKVFTEEQLKAINLELRAQIDKLNNLGFELVALTTHHGFSRNLQLLDMLTDICNTYGLMMRDQDSLFKKNNKKLEKGSVLGTGQVYNENVNIDFFSKKALEMLKIEDVVDIPTHPAYCDKELMERTTYNKQRETGDLVFIQSKELIKFFKENKIYVSNYKNSKKDINLKERLMK